MAESPYDPADGTATLADYGFTVPPFAEGDCSAEGGTAFMSAAGSLHGWAASAMADENHLIRIAAELSPAPQLFSLGKLKRKRSGAATLPATFPVAGFVVLRDARDGNPRIKRFLASAPDGMKNLAVKPTAKTQKTLDQGKSVRLKVEATYSPTGGAPGSLTRLITLKRG